MDRIDIYEGTSYGSVALFKKITAGWECKEVTIDYNFRNGGGDKNEPWPFRAVMVTPTQEIEVRIFMFAIGYHGTGPKDACDVLKYLDLVFDPEDITTTKKIQEDGHIRLRYEGRA